MHIFQDIICFKLYIVLYLQINLIYKQRPIFQRAITCPILKQVRILEFFLRKTDSSFVELSRLIHKFLLKKFFLYISHFVNNN